MSNKKIKIEKDGPYVVTGSVPLDKESIKTKDGCPDSWEKNEDYPLKESYVLCRCGKTKTPPYCGGSHHSGFNGTETAKNIPFKDQAEKTEGGAIDLYDAAEFCASAKFCECGKGTWQATEDSDDPASKELAIKEACNCPSGRLVVEDKNGKAIEPEFLESISVTEQPDENVSGPLWVKGGIPIESADGEIYEKRNRVTLCRCGKSLNKPFCDGSHCAVKFNDNDKGVNADI